MRKMALGLAALLLCGLLAGCNGLLDTVLADGDKPLPEKPSVVYDPLVAEDFAAYDGFKWVAYSWHWLEDTTDLQTVRRIMVGSTVEELIQAYGGNACSFNGGEQAKPLVDCWYDAACPDSFTVFFVLYESWKGGTLSFDTHEALLEALNGEPLNGGWAYISNHAPYRMTITVENGKVAAIESMDGYGG